MDNFDINADPYFPSSALWSPDVHPFLSTASANEGFDNYGMRGTMANYLEPPTPMSESALAHMNYGSIYSASHMSQPATYSQQLHSGQYFPEIPAPQVWSATHHSSTGRWVQVRPESPPTQTTFSVPFGDSQSPSTFGTFHSQNVHIPYQRQPSVVRAEPGQVRQFRRHRGAHRTIRNEHTNAEAGPSSLALSYVPSVGTPTPQPSGGISETTADAETNNNNNTEENKGSSKRTRNPHSRLSRQKLKGQLPVLFQWVKKRKGLKRKPFLSESLAAAAKFIPTIRQVVNEEPTFFSRGGSEKVGSERAQREQERRDMERELYRELARYYPQPDGAWKYPELLSKVLEDLEANPASLETPDEPRPLTSTAAVSEPE